MIKSFFSLDTSTFGEKVTKFSKCACYPYHVCPSCPHLINWKTAKNYFMQFYTGKFYRHGSLYCSFNYIMKVINNLACRHADIYTGYWWVTKSLSERKISGKKNRQNLYYVLQSCIFLTDVTCYSIPWHLKSLNTETFRSILQNMC